jgi:Ni,Fe-hydrogenase III small subunit/formate hydrogenlyase subunit 6/NADH:ubiquinone oxidoreductase subunit I
MFKILKKALETGIATEEYPRLPARVSEHFRGRPVFDFESWLDARPAAEVCPTGAIFCLDTGGSRKVTVDYGLCVFCGQCAEATREGAVRISRDFELATRERRELITTAEYALDPDGGHHRLSAVQFPAAGRGARIGGAIRRLIGRSIAIRQVDAGSCNGCELEIVALNNPVHDIERLGIQFVASPRHADLLLVTGPVTRNMELALRKTYAAAPDPTVVVAVGACGISGGIFGRNYATVGAVDSTIPVDVYVPGCPPRPEALLNGILLAAAVLAEKTRHGSTRQE